MQEENNEGAIQPVIKPVASELTKTLRSSSFHFILVFLVLSTVPPILFFTHVFENTLDLERGILLVYLAIGGIVVFLFCFFALFIRLTGAMLLDKKLLPKRRSPQTIIVSLFLPLLGIEYWLMHNGDKGLVTYGLTAIIFFSSLLIVGIKSKTDNNS